MCYTSTSAQHIADQQPEKVWAKAKVMIRSESSLGFLFHHLNRLNKETMLYDCNAEVGDKFYIHQIIYSEYYLSL